MLLCFLFASLNSSVAVLLCSRHPSVPLMNPFWFSLNSLVFDLLMSCSADASAHVHILYRHGAMVSGRQFLRSFASPFLYSNIVLALFQIVGMNSYFMMSLDNNSMYSDDKSGIAWSVQYPIPSGPCALCGSLVVMMFLKKLLLFMEAFSNSLSSSVSLCIALHSLFSGGAAYPLS